MQLRPSHSMFATVALLSLAASACNGHIAAGDATSSAPDASTRGDLDAGTGDARDADSDATPSACMRSAVSRLPVENCGSGACLFLRRADRPPTVLFRDSDAANGRIANVVAVTTDRAFFVTNPTVDGGQVRLLSVWSEGAEITEVDTWPEREYATITAAVAVEGALYYALAGQETPRAPVAASLRVWRSQPSRHSKVLFESRDPIGELAAQGSWVYASDAAGLVRVSRSSDEASRFIATEAPVLRFVVSENSALWVESDGDAFNVKRASLRPPSDAHAVWPARRPQDWTRPLDIALARDDSALVLDETSLSRFRPGGRNRHVLVETHDFEFEPELVVDGDTAYFRQTCDRMGIEATRRFQLGSGSLEWLHADRAFPFVPHLLQEGVWEAPERVDADGVRPSTQLYVIGEPARRRWVDTARLKR